MAIRTNLLLAAATAIVTATATGLAYADRLEDIRSRGTLLCGVLGTVPPLGFQDPTTRELAGYDIDQCGAIAKKLNVGIEYKVLSVEARVPEVTLGRVDLVSAGLAWNKARAEQISFTMSPYQVATRVVVKTSSPFQTVADLAGHKVTTPKASTSEIAMKAAVPTAIIVTFNDVPASFLALQQDMVSAFALTETSAARFVNQSNGEFRFLPEAISWEKISLGVNKDEPALLDAVNAALQAMEDAGEIESIWQKWFGEETEYKIVREIKLTPIEE